MDSILIVSGGNINIEFAKQFLKENKFNQIIAVDKGLEILDGLDIIPNHIIGDFDSVDRNVLKKCIANDVGVAWNATRAAYHAAPTNS